MSVTLSMSPSACALLCVAFALAFAIVDESEES